MKNNSVARQKKFRHNITDESSKLIFDRLIESFGVLKGINIAVSRMGRIPVDRRDLSDSMINELVLKSEEFEELLKLAGILKKYHGIGAFRWDKDFIYVYVYRV